MHTAEKLDTVDISDKMEYSAQSQIPSKLAQPKVFANLEKIPLLPLDLTKLERSFYKPTPTMKKPPALFHVLTKFLVDTHSYNGVIGITRVFQHRQIVT